MRVNMEIQHAEIQEVGEDLGNLMGRVIEVKIGGSRILSVLEQMQWENYQMRKKLNELVELTEDFEQKAKELYEVATEIDEKWRIYLRSRRKLIIAQTDTNT